MQRLDITGIVHHIGKTETIGSNGFKKREIVIVEDMTSKFPSYSVFTAKCTSKQDRTTLLDDVRLGQEVKIVFYTSAREWNGRWFSENVLLTIAPLSVKTIQEDAQGAQAVSQLNATTTALNNDCPF